jgi:cobalt/nickel transport system permease protein
MPLDIDRFAHLESSIQRWDPRVKIASLGLFVFCVAVLKTLPVALMALAAAIVFLRITGIPFDFIAGSLKWVLLFLVPFFGIMPFTYPGPPAFTVLGLDFAWEGLRLGALIVIKAVAIVLTSYAIFGSARFDLSMIALQRLKCPTVFVQMLLFTYRYIFVLIEEMRRMTTAMRVRGFVMGTNLYTLKVIGNFVGSLLVRSLDRTERVYQAMLSKGYEGQFHTLVEFRTRNRDFAKAALVIGAAVALVAIDLEGFFRTAVAGWY